MMKVARIAACLFWVMFVPQAFAGFNEGLAAARAGDLETAKQEWLPLAIRGNANAQFNLGRLYDIGGGGVAQNYKEAATWYRKATEQGQSDAQLSLGYLYYYGYGVPQNYKEASSWFRKAAEQGNAKAQENMAMSYYLGHGVPKDEGKSVFWYRKAAEQGLPDSQNNLGTAYRFGKGASKSVVVAYALYNLASNSAPSTVKHSENRSDVNRSDVSTEMTQAEIDAAQELTKQMMQPGNMLKALDDFLKSSK